MPTRIQCLRSTLFAILAVLFARVSYGQTATSAFERSLTYSNAIAELDTKYAGLRSAGSKLIAERQDTLQRLAETNKTVSEILQSQAYKSIALAQTELVGESMLAELNGFVASQQTQTSPVETGVDNRHTPQVQLAAQLGARDARNFRETLSARGNQLARVRVEYDLVRHQMKTLNEAGRLAVERHINIVRELETIVNEMLAWDTKTVELFNQYWSLADVAGVKSDFELRAALRQLSRSSNENAGALFLKAITLVRLEQYEDALPLLNQLANVPSIQLVATAARAEVFARTDKKREAQSELRKTSPLGLNDARVRMHRAIALAACEEFKQAEAEWEAILKLGGHEVAARRAIALINASYSAPTDRNKAKASEYSQLALQLDSEDWASEIACALAYAANGQADKGVESAARAAELAAGCNQTLCKEIAEKIQAAQKVCWNF